MMDGTLLTQTQKLAVQYFTVDVQYPFIKATTFTPVFQLLLVMDIEIISSATRIKGFRIEFH